MMAVVVAVVVTVIVVIISFSGNDSNCGCGCNTDWRSFSGSGSASSSSNPWFASVSGILVAVSVQYAAVAAAINIQWYSGIDCLLILLLSLLWPPTQP